MSLPKEYFENKTQQIEIQIAINEAIPEGVYYHNLVLALSEMLQRFIVQAFKGEIYGASVENEESEGQRADS